MRDRKRPGSASRLVLIAAVIAAAVTAIGCGEKSEDTTGNATEEFDLALDFFVNADHAGIFTALERGYFADAGLEVRPGSRPTPRRRSNRSPRGGSISPFPMSPR